jgi:hypothetical protein
LVIVILLRLEKYFLLRIKKLLKSLNLKSFIFSFFSILKFEKILLPKLRWIIFKIYIRQNDKQTTKSYLKQQEAPTYFTFK